MTASLYRLTCAGCGTVFKFRSMMAIGVRVRAHRCEDAKEGAPRHPESRPVGLMSAKVAQLAKGSR